MTPREALEITLKMWDHIAINDCGKYTAIRELKLPERMDSSCALCEYSKITFPNRPGCSCLITWPTPENHCMWSYYEQWTWYGMNQKDAQKIADLALEELNKRYPEED